MDNELVLGNKNSVLTSNRIKYQTIFNMKIYINGLPFQIKQSQISGRELCELIKSPPDNSKANKENGDDVPINEPIPCFEGDHFVIARLVL